MSINNEANQESSETGPLRNALDQREGIFNGTFIGTTVGVNNGNISIQQEDAAYDVQGLPNPYLGLQSFSYTDRERYAGRAIIAEQTLRRLVAPGDEQTVLFITGASGNGKSSFARAGLLPKLIQHYVALGIQARFVEHFVPGRFPIAGLIQAVSLLTQQPSALDVNDVIKQPLAFWEALHTSTASDAVNIIVLDQFEELFTQSDPLQRDALFVLLEQLPLYSAVRTHILITLRTDYLPDLLDRPVLHTLAQQGIKIPALDAEELRQAIVYPLAQVDNTHTKRFEDALLDRLIADASGDAAYLPLLQATLDELWEGGSLKLGKYTNLIAALERQAERVYEYTIDGNGLQQPRSKDEQSMLMQVMLDLVDVSLDNDPRRDVRHSRPRAALEAGDETRHRIVDELLRARLLSQRTETLDGPSQTGEIIEIIHETVLRQWKRLRDTLASDSERRLLQLRSRFEQAVRDWKARANDDEVNVNQLLSQADELEQRNDIALRLADAQELLRRSRAIRDKRRSEALKKAQNDVRRLQLFVGLLVLMLVVTVGAFAYANNQRRLSQQQARINQAQALAANAQAQLGIDPERSILLAMEAISVTKRLGEPVVPQAEEALHNALFKSKIRVTLRSHSDYVLDAVYNQDGTRIVTASSDGTTKVWNAATNKEVLTLHGHIYPIYDVAYSPDAQSIAAVGDNNTVKIWNTTKNQELTIDMDKEGSGERHYSVSYSPDGLNIVVADSTGKNQAHIWNVQTGQLIRTLEGHTDSIFNASYSPDGKYIVTASADNTAKIWEASIGKEKGVLKGHSDRVISASYSPDGNFIVTASWDKSLKVWSAQTYQNIATLEGHSDKVRTGLYSPDGKHILSSGWDKTAIIWNAQTYQVEFVLAGHQNKITKAIYRQDGHEVATIDESGVLKFWNTLDGKETGSFQISSQELRGISYNPNGQELVLGGTDGMLRIWDRTQEAVRSVFEGQLAGIVTAEFSHNGQLIVTAGRDGTAKLWNAESGKMLLTLKAYDHPVFSASFSPDDHSIVTGGGFPGDEAKVWDVNTGQLVFSPPHGVVGSNKPKYSPDGKYIISSGIFTSTTNIQQDYLRRVTVWEVTTGRIAYSLEGKDIVITPSYSRDGKYILLPYSDGTLEVYSLDLKTLKFTLRGHKAQILTADSTLDGKFIATASADGAVKLWDAQTGDFVEDFLEVV